MDCCGGYGRPSPSAGTRSPTEPAARAGVARDRTGVIIAAQAGPSIRALPRKYGSGSETGTDSCRLATTRAQAERAAV
jgi:hypothetical protein